MIRQITQPFVDAWEARKNILFFYSPYNFLQEIERDKHYKIIQNMFIADNVTIFEVKEEGNIYFFCYQYLSWDSDYFKIPTYKLLGILFENNSYQSLNKAVKTLMTGHLSKQKGYYFAEIPSEDTILLQALTANQFKFIETRLTYYIGNLDKFHALERYPVRLATKNDIEILSNVARNTRNIYDRLHADTSFNIALADEYLATYITNAIQGFADVVLMPNDPNYSGEAFLTANYLKDTWQELGKNVSKMVLSAVAPSCKGWYYKLITEMTYHLRDKGADYIFMNTQSTNRAVFKIWERLGYRLGCTNHILAFQNIENIDN